MKLESVKYYWLFKFYRNSFKFSYVFIYSFGFCLLACGLHSQNLVFNPGFESDSAAVINEYSQKGAGQILVDGWMVPTDATSDYYNSHESTIRGHPIPKARTGQGRVAMIWSNASNYAYREFITGNLIQPLEKNKKYKISFYICRYKYAHHSPMQVGVYFSKDSLVQTGYYANIKLEPQVAIDDYTFLEDRFYWHKFEGIYTAAGDERHLTLGNFKSTINDQTTPSIKVSNKFTIVATKLYAYVFVDDVVVEEYHEEVKPMEKKKLFLYLIDASSSMKNDKKYEKLKSGIKKSIKNLPYDAYFSFFTFSSASEKILEPTQALLYDLADVLDEVKIGGATNASEAINFAYNNLKNYEDYDIEIVMCSDGKFILSDEKVQQIKEAKHHFNLLQIGGGRSAQLEELVNFTGGKYVVTDTKNIKEDVKTLSVSISNHSEEVQYTKMKTGGVILKWSLLVLIAATVVGLAL